MKSFSERARALFAIALVAVGAPSAVAGPGAGYDVRLSIQSRNSGQIKTRGVNMLNDIIGGALGLNPAAGPHLIAGDPTFYPQHQAKMVADLNIVVPDANFSGIIQLDYEHWWPCWEWSPNVQVAWTNYIKTSRTDLLNGHPTGEWDAIIQAEYKKTVRTYYENTIGYVRAARPKARVTFYGLPLRSYWIFNGYSDYGVDLNKYRQIHEQEMSWYFSLVDVICPSIYPVYKVGSPPSGNIQDPAGNEAYILGMVSESVRYSLGKPVYPFFMLRYHPSSGYGNEFVNPINLRQGLEIPRQAGAAGVVIWDFFYTEAELNAWQSFYDASARDTVYNVTYPGFPTDLPVAATISTNVSPPPPQVADETAAIPAKMKVQK
ncbi:MAG: hypothetical protein KF805_11250 [Phycisphaeraceae bacterium]|nr:hypothetical protein [Phycisphaeraceae bacterium]